MLAHETADLLVIDDHALLPEGGLDPAPAVVFELVADRSHRCDDGGVVGRTDRFVVESGAGHSHQPASLGNADAAGPTIADVVSLLGRGRGRRAPFRNSSSRACLPTRRSSAAIRAS